MSFWPVPEARTYFQPIPVLVDQTKQRRAIHEDEYRRWQKKEQEQEVAQRLEQRPQPGEIDDIDIGTFE